MVSLLVSGVLRDNGTPQMAMGASIGVLCALIGTPIVLIVRKVLDKAFPVYEY